MTSPRDTVRRRMRAMQSKAFLDAASSALYAGADAVRAEAFQSISRGAVSGKGHVPSAPGEPPNRDTGVLQAGLAIELPEPLVSRVVARAPYSAALEFGTSKIAARPYMRPARDKLKFKVKRDLERRVNRAVKVK